LPETIHTDPQRLQQILNNLLSNAFKFTERGKVEFVAEPAGSGWSPSNDALNRAPQVVAFRVIDTGIGIPLEKQLSIFEPFPQADASPSRKYGGTGLGLSICRELTRLLGGEIRLQSESGVGSIFTVYLPGLAPRQPRRVHSTEDGWSETQAVEMTQKVLVARAGADSQWEADSAPAGGGAGAPQP